MTLKNTKKNSGTKHSKRPFICLLLVLSMLSSLITPAYSDNHAPFDTLLDELISGSGIDTLISTAAIRYGEGETPISLSQFRLTRCE